MAVFLIADTHFGDGNILRYESRPFVDTSVMDAELIKRWNSAVSVEDTVWHLGDFGASGHERDVLKQLNGHIRLVRGNHDVQTNEYYRACGFEEVYDLPVLFDGFWILSHSPVYVSVNMPYANIFGHVHANPMYRDFSSHHYCVSAERISYTPISYDSVRSAVLSHD